MVGGLKGKKMSVSISAYFKTERRKKTFPHRVMRKVGLWKAKLQSEGPLSLRERKNGQGDGFTSVRE